MPKTKAFYQCNACGATSPNWSGRCFTCQEWGTIELAQESQASTETSGKIITATKLSQIKNNTSSDRLKTKISEIDTVLGGGLVKGSVILLAGQPGTGKSTLLMQIASQISQSKQVLYFSGEESLAQVATRAKRLGVKADQLAVAATHSSDDIATTIINAKPDLVIVDSIQTIATKKVSGNQGGVAQIVASSQALISVAKSTNTCLILVGHVTKEGNIAGPKLLEHIVDVVLELEGDKFAGFKLLRGIKNRYGTTDEIAVLEMTASGLRIAKNPSKALLEERQVVDGSVVFAAIEGTKPLLVEIQALTNRTNFGYPKRTAVGFSQNRLNLLIAVLDKRTKLNLEDLDVYLSVTSGINIDEPAVDLAVCMAIASSATGLSLAKDTVVYGEVGLGGEIRSVLLADKRKNEAQKLGFKQIIGPSTVKNLKDALNQYLAKVKT